MRNRKRHRWRLSRPCGVGVALLLLLCWSAPAAGQCFGGVETYEKTSGTTVVCDADDGDAQCRSRGLLTQPDTAVTRDCIAICKQSANCNSFTVDYLNSRCQSYGVDTNTRSGRRKLEKDSVVNFFEKVCLRGMRQNEFDKLCNPERGWSFERVLDAQLDGHDHKRVEGVESRGECARLCLLERDFDCRSAEYDAADSQCVLSREDRRTQPEAFRTGVTGVDYVENQCARPLPDCSYSSSQQDVTVVSMDDVLFSRSASDCQRFCDDARAFHCRAFAQKDDRCYLSGDDAVNLEGVPQPVEIGAVYKEKICARSTCDGGIFTYEKTTGHFLRTGMQEPLEMQGSSPGITLRCAELCSGAGSDCPAFSVDYSGGRCFKLDRNTQGRGDSLAPRDGANYFEKICLRGEVSGCRDKAWAVERVPNAILQGHDDRQFDNVPSRRDCAELCLRERGFRCRSAEYDAVALTCALSRESRRTRPDDMREARNIDYLENTCFKTSELTCPYEPRENAYPRYLDAVLNDVKDEVACEVQCTFYEPFVCRAFAFYPSALQCFISGDDRASAGDEALRERPGTDYYERNCDPEYSPSKDDFGGGGGGGSGGRGGDDGAGRFDPAGDANSVDFGGRNNLGGAEGRLLSSAASSSSSSGGVVGGGGVLASERRCSSGRLAFEKTTSFELIRGSPTRLFSDRDGGIVKECADRCRADRRCKGFNMDYNRNECQGVVRNSEGNLFNLKPSAGVSFFEAICLRSRDCGALWTFERFVDMELRGSVRDTVRDVSKTECQDLCLKASAFNCLSANYDHLVRECHLSDDNRFTRRPDEFAARQGVDYLENQCQSDRSRCEYSAPIRGQYLVLSDKVLDAFTESTCRQACTQERDFKCRSYSFLSEARPGTPQCFLSGDTQASAGSRNTFQLEDGAIYAEKECGSAGGDRRPQTRPQSSDGNGARPIDEGRFDFPDADADDGTSDNTVGGGGGGDRGRETGNRGRDEDRDADRDRDRDRSRYDGDPADCRATGLQTTFEKVVDTTFEGGPDGDLDRQKISTSKDIGIIGQCLDECSRRGAECLAVTLLNERGGRQRCFSLGDSAGGSGAQTEEETGVTYYEKICARRICRKQWTFTRVTGYELASEANEELSEVRSASECRNLCLESSFFECRSATYYGDSRVCRLSEETRRSTPQDYRPAGRDVHYMENECSDIPTNCEYVDQPGTYLPFTDTYFPNVNDIEECRSHCSAQGTYNCRSFNYNAFRKECFLSADDSASLPAQLQSDRDFTFSERAGCNSGKATGQQFGAEGVHVRVECTPSDMLVHLSLARDFNGRIYATGNPQNCFELGNGQSEMTLRIPLNSQCGTVQQNRGRYVNHVVIQENPVIMQNTDKTVRVECAFTAEDQTVSFKPIVDDGRDGAGGGISVTVPFQPTGTNIVTNTAPTPGVRMRVVRRNGETASMVGLGEDLQLRIEIDQDSAFGLFARRLEARTDNGELMNLIDDSGCPVNELIFPQLELETSSRALYADFKAFRFPSTPIVNFVATVQFCQEICDPMECFGDIESYGRRKRSANNDTDDITVNHTAKTSYYKITIPTIITAKTNADDNDQDILTNAIDTSDNSPKLQSLGRRRRHSERQPRFLPEHVDLGLRLTVGEEVNQKPFLPSTSGEGHFPEFSPYTSTEAGDRSDRSLSNAAAYYPGLNATSPPYICSAPSTLIAVIVVILVINVVMVAAFVLFYRKKRKFWSKRVGVISAPSSAYQPQPTAAVAPPPLPNRPSTAIGTSNSYSTSGVMMKPQSPYNQPQGVSRQRIAGLHNSMTSLPRGDGEC